MVRAVPIGMMVQPPSRLRRVGGKKKAELMRLAQEHLSPAQLKDAVPVRSYKLTTSGWTLPSAHPEVVASTRRRAKVLTSRYLLEWILNWLNQ